MKATRPDRLDDDPIRPQEPNNLRPGSTAADNDADTGDDSDAPETPEGAGSATEREFPPDVTGRRAATVRPDDTVPPSEQLVNRGLDLADDDARRGSYVPDEKSRR